MTLIFMMTSFSPTTVYKHHHSFFCPIYSLVLSLWPSRLQTMTSIIDPTKIGKPVRVRRHVRTLTGMYFHYHHHRLSRSSLWPKDIFPKKTRRGKTNGQGVKRRSGERECELLIRVSLRHLFFVFPHDSNTTKIQMLIKSQSLLLTTYKRRLLVSATILVRPFFLILP